MNILDQIVAAKRVEVAKHKEAISIDIFEKRNLLTGTTLSIKQALQASSTGIIAEFKRRSPSKGWIKEGADAELIVPAYQQAGAAACSILTDEPFFGGSLFDLAIARPHTSIPLLRKEFVIDAYQLYQAKAMGADFVLLIAAILTPKEVFTLTETAHALGLEVLLEIHSEEEFGHICPEVDVVGINNRDLKTFTTDVNTSHTLGAKLPASLLKISESGIYTPETVLELRAAGFSGCLMGECFMKALDPAAALSTFIAALSCR
jgi:indole-3-glycerol phosphate synthase